jgi:hypothetical protein
LRDVNAFGIGEGGDGNWQRHRPDSPCQTGNEKAATITFWPIVRRWRKERNTGNMKCATSYCRGIKTKSGHSPFCAKCRYRRFRDKFPAKCAFNNLRKRAHERGHSFELSFSKFEELWNAGLAKNHGRGAGFLSIDRIDNNRGYADDNVRLLTYSENSRKQYVPFFRNQFHHDNPTAEEIKATELAVAKMIE